MPQAISPNRPFRWDLVERDQLGSLLDGIEAPNLWFLDELARCAAKVIARSADGDLCFVGRSADSLHDLLGGALTGTSWRGRLRTLPLSLRWDAPVGSSTELRQLRTNLAAEGLEPTRLVRRRRPLVFVDLVYGGATFAGLFRLLRVWSEDEAVTWSVVRTRLRFVGITRRTHTSPKTWRWHQHAPWTAKLRAGAIVNVSLDLRVWNYFGNEQTKLTPSFRRDLWSSASVRSPRRDERTRKALAEAVALVECGRTRELRERLARLMAAEPAFREPWLRGLALELRRRVRGRGAR
jgi:hypothetical protein